MMMMAVMLMLLLLMIMIDEYENDEDEDDYEIMTMKNNDVFKMMLYLLHCCLSIEVLLAYQEGSQHLLSLSLSSSYIHPDGDNDDHNPYCNKCQKCRM